MEKEAKNENIFYLGFVFIFLGELFNLISANYGSIFYKNYEAIAVEIIASTLFMYYFKNQKIFWIGLITALIIGVIYDILFQENLKKLFKL